MPATTTIAPINHATERPLDPLLSPAALAAPAGRPVPMVVVVARRPTRDVVVVALPVAPRVVEAEPPGAVDVVRDADGTVVGGGVAPAGSAIVNMT